jgi:hypothetical protein
VVLRVAVLAVLLILAAMGDDRHVGLIADGRQTIRTAVALAETGEVGHLEVDAQSPGGAVDKHPLHH